MKNLNLHCLSANRNCQYRGRMAWYNQPNKNYCKPHPTYVLTGLPTNLSIGIIRHTSTSPSHHSLALELPAIWNKQEHWEYRLRCVTSQVFSLNEFPSSKCRRNHFALVWVRNIQWPHYYDLLDPPHSNKVNHFATVLHTYPILPKHWITFCIFLIAKILEKCN